MKTIVMSRAEILTLVPHQGAMCLWDEVLACSGDAIHCRTQGHRDAAHPLRRDGRLAAVHLVEYGAQAMAIHGGLAARLAGGAGARPGVLAAVRDFSFAVATLDDLAAPLECRARRLVAGAGGWLYELALEAGGRALARGRASVIHPA